MIFFVMFLIAFLGAAFVSSVTIRGIALFDTGRALVVEFPLFFVPVIVESLVLFVMAVFRRRKGIARMLGFMESDVVVTAPLFHVCGRGRIQSKGTGG